MIVVRNINIVYIRSNILYCQNQLFNNWLQECLIRSRFAFQLGEEKIGHRKEFLFYFASLRSLQSVCVNQKIYS